LSTSTRLHHQRSHTLPDPLSFPTRRSSDLRLRHMQPSPQRSREGFEAARAARDDFAAQFYLKLFPPPDRTRVLDEALAKCQKARSEEHTSELQSPYDLVCRLLLEKKKKTQK